MTVLLMPNRNTKQLPFITVCMPVRNEARFIEDTLVQLLVQDYPKDRYEIIVAEGESDDGTQLIVQRMAEQYPQIILKNNPKRLSSAGRNIGFKTGQGDIFVVVDGHSYIPTGKLLKNIVDCFEKSGADCLGRPQLLDPPNLTKFQKAVAMARKSIIGHGGNSLIYSDYEGYVSPVSHGAVYTRRVFDTVGYVDESFDACEDVEFNYRVEKAGFKTFMSPSIAIKYFPRKTLLSLFQQMTRYGKGRFRLLKKHPDSLSLTSLIPTMFVLGITVLPIITVISLKIGLLILFIYGLYLIIVIINAINLSKKTKEIILPTFVSIFFFIHTGLGYGFLKEAIHTTIKAHRLEKS